MAVRKTAGTAMYDALADKTIKRMVSPLEAYVKPATTNANVA